MSRSKSNYIGYLVPVLLALPASLGVADQAGSADAPVAFEQHEGSLAIRLGDVQIASYVYRDAKIPRPYFAHVKTSSGIQVSRNHPPRHGTDRVDHTGLHTGIWLSFGDLSGCDYWRLKARTEHVRFVDQPSAGAGRGSFAVLNRYRAKDGRGTVCEETCRYVIRSIAGGYLIQIDSEFRPGERDLVFGDQEEMGLGIRVATPLAVTSKLGGRILDKAGRRNGDSVWGKTAEWCDYAGPLGGRWAGMTVMAGPNNFRPCWCHARDYGLVAMNPFGRRAFTNQATSRVIVKRGEVFRLEFGVVIHETATEADFRPEKAYRDFAQSQVGAKP